MKTKHGYGRYTNGCRCDVCTEAKAAYMRAKRSKSQQVPGGLINDKGRYVAPIDKHGTIHGYQQHACRCFDCTAAKSAATKRQYAARPTQ